MGAPEPEDIYEETRKEGERRLERPFLEVVSTALAAGFDIIAGVVAMALVETQLQHLLGKHAAHVFGSVAFGIGLFFIAGRMRYDGDWQALAPYTVATALASLAILGLFVGLGPRYVGDTSAPLSSVGGLIQRLSTLTAWTWHLVAGAWLLRRPAPSPARP